MTETEKNKLVAKWLITNAKTRLFLADINDDEQLPQKTIADVSFLPLAAKGSANGNNSPQIITLHSKDYNFEITFIKSEQIICCKLQAQGFNAISAVAKRQAQLNFGAAESFLISFNDKGYAQLNLNNGHQWHALPITINIL